MTKKRHHYVPKSYLKSFCDVDGKLQVYRKDATHAPIRQSPDKVGFHKYYYSQPLPNGGRENDELENLFGTIEAQWPGLSALIRDMKSIDDHGLYTLIDFIGLQRIRVPAARDAVEKILAELIITNMRVMDAAGKLPAKPPGHEDILDNIAVAIDPHRSLLAMRHLLDGYYRLVSEIGIGVLHNKTDIPFLTSDNPVIWFDPSVPEAEMKPYQWQPPGPVLLLFPVAPDCLIYGHSAMQERFRSQGVAHYNMSDFNMAETINRHVCRFAYEVVFAQKIGQESVIREYAEVSPVVQTYPLPGAQGKVLFSSVFGTRRQKPKWAD